MVVLLFGGLVASTTRLSPLLGDTEGLTRVGLAGATAYVQVADTPEARARGLSDTPQLPADRGMLFLFPREGYYTFWMKGMAYSLDILWLSESGTVLHMEKSASPESYPATFVSPMPARSVLELPAGFVEKHNVQLGQQVTIFG